MGPYFCAVDINMRLGIRLMTLGIVLWLCFTVADARQRLETEKNDGMWKYIVLQAPTLC